jgi:hypothetical protein
MLPVPCVETHHLSVHEEYDMPFPHLHDHILIRRTEADEKGGNIVLPRGVALPRVAKAPDAVQTNNLDSKTGVSIVCRDVNPSAATAVNTGRRIDHCRQAA